MKKDIVIKIIVSIMCVFLFITYFVFDIYRISDEFTALQATKDNWYYAFALVLPVAFIIFIWLNKENIKWFVCDTISCFGLILCLLMSIGDKIMLTGWYISIICYLILSIISTIKLRIQTRIYTEMKNKQIKEENEKFAKELMENDKFKK